VTFRRVLLGQRLVAWNTLIHRLGDIHLSPEPDEFRWNLHVDGTFSVKYFYNAILLSDLPVDNNKKIWKMKIPLKINFLDGIFVVGLFSPKTILLSGIGMEVHGAFFVIRTKPSDTYSSSANSRDLYGQSSK
jgi:hypothetical protein